MSKSKKETKVEDEVKADPQTDEQRAAKLKRIQELASAKETMEKKQVDKSSLSPKAKRVLAVVKQELDKKKANPKYKLSFRSTQEYKHNVRMYGKGKVHEYLESL